MRRTSLLLLVLFGTYAANAANYPEQMGPKSVQNHPYDLIGQLFFKSGRTEYIGSGSVIGRKSVLTAGHNLYDGNTGWSTRFQYYRATYGETRNPVRIPKKRFLLSGYRANADSIGGNDLRTFACDSGGLRFGAVLAGGDRIPFTGDRSFISRAPFQILVGYGAEGQHDGDYPLAVSPSDKFSSVYGAFYESNTIYIEGGMSGGPLLAADQNGILNVEGVIVSGSTRPVAGGVRVLDRGLAKFIRTYLP